MSQSPKHEVLNEGLISYATDLISAFRLIKVLYQDYNKTDAFKLGIIDENGKKIKSPVSLDEKSAYSPFMRLAFKLKKLVNAVPGGDTKLGSLAAAYAMLKEGDEIDLTKLTKEDLDNLFEDAPVNVAGGVAGQDKPLTKKVLRRPAAPKAKDLPKIFEVSEEEFKKFRDCKLRYEKWETQNKHRTDIFEFFDANPDVGFVVKTKDGQQLFLR